MAGLNAPNESGYEKAGWYVLCNARVTVSADKSELTGWGVGGSAAFHSKYNRFVGMIFFHSDNPENLPWTTTKRGLNRESKVYLQSRGRMTVAAKPVLSFLNKMYPTDMASEPAERALAEGVRSVDARGLVGLGNRSFHVRPTKAAAKTTVRIQFDAETKDVEAVRKHVRKSLSANKIGELSFNYYLTEEGLR
jgi:hypothetical protein